MTRPSRRTGAVLAAGLTAALTVSLAAPSLAATTPARPDAAATTAVKAVTAAAGTPGRTTHRAAGEFAPSAALTQLVTQPDGRQVSAVLTDMSVGGALESGGYTIGRAADGTWRYATGRDARGVLQLSPAVVGRDAVPAGVAKGAGRYTPKAGDPAVSAQTQLQRQLRIASAKAQAEAAGGGPRVFKFPVLMLATWWDTDKGQTSPQFQAGDTPETYKKLLDGFGGNPRGTLTEFYYESSFGQFLVQVDVYGTFVSNRSRQDRCYYGNIGQAQDDGDLDPLDTNLGVGGGGALGMALEAVPQADPVVDFSQYDNDGNGSVDFTAIVHSGADMAVTGDVCNTWSHALQATLGEGTAAEEAAGLPAGTLARAGIPTSDGVAVDRVLTMPEFNSKGAPLTIGVASHEMGHALGEPDYYNTTYTSAGDGEFDIMGGSGYFGHPAGSSPGIFNPASRVFQKWVTPTVVHGDLRSVTLRPRNVLPRKGYTVGTPDPNLLLVPTYEIKAGETDTAGHTWTANDVYGLAVDPATGKSVVEGYYVELAARTVNAPPLHAGQTRGALFDRVQHGSGLIVWHFDDWKRSNTYFGGNDAQSDGERYQMDVEEFDRNDNTQELQRNETRGGPEDYLVGAATGITSGTRQVPPGFVAGSGTPSPTQDLSGTALGPADSTVPFTVPANPANLGMVVSAGSDGVGDCKLTLVDPRGKKYGPQDSTGPAEKEVLTVARPVPGAWKATVADFAGCGTWSGTVVFNGGSFATSGAADTWSTWSKAPTGWAFTNVGPKDAEGLDSSVEGGDAGQEKITLDVLQLTGKLDVSPGFAGGALLPKGGRGPVVARRSNNLSVPVFSNGSKAAKGVTVTVHEGSATGPVVARRTVDLPGFARTEVPFTWMPKTPGPTRLVTVVDEAGRLAEGSEANNAQSVLLDVTPAAPKVLVVDDDGDLTGERSVEGALAALGIPYAVSTKHATAALMEQYSAVVWQTGIERYLGQLDTDDQKAIATYLDHGGKVLLAGNRLFDALGAAVSATNPTASDSANAFLGHYFGARFTSGSYNVVQTDQFTAVGAGVLSGYRAAVQTAAGRGVVQLAGLSSAGAAPNGATYRPFGSAKPAMTFPVKDFPTVQPAGETPQLGISVDGDAAHKRFQTIALGFNLGQAARADSTVGLLRSAMTHFGLATRAPLSTSTPQVFHTSLRDRASGVPAPVTAVVTGAGRAPVVLHYRRHGQGGFYATTMQPGSRPATYVGTIPGAAVTPDGVDYWISVGRVSEPLRAASGAYAHSFAVHVPEVGTPVAVLAKDQVAGRSAGRTSGGSVATGPLPTTGASTAASLLGLLVVGSGLVLARTRRASAAA